MFIIEVGHRFINVKTGVVIEVTSLDGTDAQVATVLATGATVKPRTLKVSSLHGESTTARGTERASGYVALHALPAGHPFAPAPQAAEKTRDSFRAPDFSVMSDEEVSDYANARKAERDLAEDLHDKAKKELKNRNPEARPYIFGNVYVGISTNHRFDPALAKQMLTSAEYAAILKPKPDATLAKEVLGEARYSQICKDHGNKVEVRFATDKDRMKLAETEEIEKAKAEIDAFSLQAEDPFAFL